jgi:LmbE family N-acetylglucosaminyl deacetylase
MFRQEENSRLLAVMAHPDDAELLIGGTLLHLKTSGWKLGIVTMTTGDCGSATLSKEEISRLRASEARAAASYLDAWYDCAGLLDNEVFANSSNIRRVVELIRRFDPDIVITHSPIDYMVDHEETSRLARSAAFASAMALYQTGDSQPANPGRATPGLYYCDPVEGNSPMGERIWPQFYIDITATIEQKRELLALHRSQREWLRAHHGIDQYLEQMTAWATKYGKECGVPYAEGFRQHLGHGYQGKGVLQETLKSHVRLKEETI